MARDEKGWPGMQQERRSGGMGTRVSRLSRRAYFHLPTSYFLLPTGRKFEKQKSNVTMTKDVEKMLKATMP